MRIAVHAAVPDPGTRYRSRSGVWGLRSPPPEQPPSWVTISPKARLPHEPLLLWGGLACPARRLTWSGVQRPPAPFCCAMTASGFPSGTRSARANFHLGTGLRRVVHSVYRPPSTVKSAIAPLTVEPLCRCSDGQTRLRPPAGTSVERYQPLTNSRNSQAPQPITGFCQFDLGLLGHWAP